MNNTAKAVEMFKLLARLREMNLEWEREAPEPPLPPSGETGPRQSHQEAREFRRVRAQQAKKAYEGLKSGIMEVIRSLPEREYDVVHAHYIEGRVMEDVAAELGVSIRCAYARKRRAMCRIQKMLESSGR